MALKEFLIKYLKVFLPKNQKNNHDISILKFNILIYPLIILVAFLVYGLTYNYINNQKSKNEQNLENFFSSNEFKEIKGKIFNNLKSPYFEFDYKIENNDSIGKILKKFKISDNETQQVIDGLKEKKLTNVYAGRELNIVLKKK